jgi:hypothetical protein
MAKKRRKKRPVQQLMLVDQTDWMKLRAEVEALSSIALDLARNVTDLHHEVLTLRAENEKRSTRAKKANKSRAKPLDWVVDEVVREINTAPAAADPVDQADAEPALWEGVETPCPTNSAAENCAAKDAGSSDKGLPPLSPSTNGKMPDQKKSGATGRRAKGIQEP